MKRNKEELYTMKNRSIHQGYITIRNMYAPNIRAPKYMKQTLTDLKREIESSTIMVRDFNAPLSIIEMIDILIGDPDRRLKRKQRTSTTL